MVAAFIALALLLPVLPRGATAATVHDHWTTELDLRYHAGDDAVRGRWTERLSVTVGDDVDIGEIARVTVVDEPYQKLHGFRATLTRPDGTTRTFRRDDLGWATWSAGSRMLVRVESRMRSTLIPSVRVGDRLDVRIDYVVDRLHGIPPVGLHDTGHPTRERTLRVRHPNDHRLLWSVRGPDPLLRTVEVDSTQQDDAVVVRWTLRDLRPHPAEALALGPPGGGLQWTAAFAETSETARADAFAAGPAWFTVGKGYARRIAPTLEANDEIVAAAREVVVGATSNAERIERLYRHVQSSCRYLGLFEGLGGILPEPASTTFERRYGDCKGLGTLLIAMLRAVDVEAHPVLVAADRWIDPDVPNMTQFNHFAVWAEDGRGGVWLDPTYDGLPAGLFPTRNVVSPVLVLRPGAVRLVEVPADVARRGRVEVEIDGRIDADGRWQISLRETRTDNARLMATLAEREHTTEERRQLHADRLLDRGLRAAVASVDVQGRDDWGAPLRVHVEALARTPLPRAGRRMFFPRRILPVRRFDLRPATRRTPVDLRSLPDRVERWRLQLPPGTTVTADSLEAEGAGSRVRTRWWVDGDVLFLERHLQLRPRVVPADSVSSLATVLDTVRDSEAGHVEIRFPEASESER